MSADEPKAAPSLADRIAQSLEAWPKDDMILRANELRETLAALRAVEAERKIHHLEPCESCMASESELIYLRSAVEAVRGLPTARELNSKVAELEFELKAANFTIEAYKRDVEAVRAFSIKTRMWTSTVPSDYREGWRDGYRDGVEAVQALLEGER